MPDQGRTGEWHDTSQAILSVMIENDGVIPAYNTLGKELKARIKDQVPNPTLAAELCKQSATFWEEMATAEKS